jgi:Xaa-Pro aminopeptidase
MKMNNTTRVNWNGLYAGMDAGQLDVILGASIENFFYITDCYLMSHIMLPDRLGIALAPRQGNAAAVVCEAEVVQTRQDSWIEDIRTYVEFAKTPMQAVAKWLTEHDLAAGRVGIEKGFLAAGHAEELAGLLPRATILAADAVFQHARSIKTPEEIERMHEAARATERAILDAFRAARPGHTEKSVSDHIFEGLIADGATSPWVVLGSGDRTAINHPYAGAKKLTPGETLRVDVGGCFAGYQSDIGRTAVIGEPSAEQASVYERVLAAGRETIAALRPGIRACDIYAAGVQALQSRGFAVGIQAIGHSFGTGLHDYPMLRAGEEGVLEPGMILAIEPAARDSRGWIYHIEDTIHLTETGPAVLTTLMEKESIFIIE